MLPIIVIIVNFGWAYWIYFYQKKIQQKWLQSLLLGLGALNFLAGCVTLFQLLD